MRCRPARGRDSRDMAGGKCRGEAYIHDLAAGCDHAHYCGNRDWLWPGKSVQEYRPVFVDDLHLTEIGRQVRGLGRALCNKGIFFDQKERVGAFLVTEGGERVVGDLAPACRTGTMRRTEDDAVSQRQDLFCNAVVDFFCHLRLSCLPEKISPCNIAKKKCIAGKDHIRFMGDFGVCKDKRDTLFRVPRGFKNRKFQRSKRKPVAFTYRVPVCKVHSGTIVDLRVAPVRKVPAHPTRNPRSGAFRKYE